MATSRDKRDPEWPSETLNVSEWCQARVPWQDSGAFGQSILISHLDAYDIFLIGLSASSTPFPVLHTAFTQCLYKANQMVSPTA